MTEFFNAETRAEHRRYPRTLIKLRVHYKCLQKGDVSRALDSLAEDLGAGGMAMRMGQKLEPGQLLMVAVFLPKTDKRAEIIDTPVFLEKDCITVSILSRVVWCTMKKDHEYIAGIEFWDLNREHRKQFKDFLIDFNLDKPDSDLYLE